MKRYTKPDVPIKQKIADNIEITSGDCWIWLNGKDEYGYGQIWYNSTNNRTHRVAYELYVGKIPKGLTLDHLCRNRVCCNPDHLEPVTSAENTRRGNAGKYNLSKRECPLGHEYNEENTYRRKNGSRFCRACNRLRANIRRAKCLNQK